MHLFANDLNYIDGQILKMSVYLQCDVWLISPWCSTNGLAMNESKTTIISLIRTRDILQL